MPSKLPGIEMPPPQPEPPPLVTRPVVDPIDTILDELGEKDIPSEDDVEGELQLTAVEPKPSFEEDEVFNTKEAEQSQPATTSETGEVPEKKGRRKYQRKGEMTEKQKAHLERIRAKALENKKKRKEEKEALQKEKNEALEEKREKKRLEQEQKKQEQEQRDLEERQSKESERLAQAMSANMYSKQDLEMAMVNAIHTYDTHRKEQKAVKKKKQAEEAQKSQQTRLIQQAINPQPTQDPWRQYFS